MKPDQQRLLAVMLDDKYPITERAAAGRDINQFGDPRSGVRLLADGLPDIEWCDVPAGYFLFGSDKQEDPQTYDDETPQRHLNIPVFRIAKYLVTYRQFQAFIEAPDGYHNSQWWHKSGVNVPPQPSQPEWRYDNYPRERVNWYDAMAFCRWLSARLGYLVTLPTEAQWEKAARGTDGRIYPWGNTYQIGYANIKESNLNGGVYLQQPTAVGLYPNGASPYQVLDMSGNLREWTLTEYDTRKDDTISHNSRTVRGGSWSADQSIARAACRDGSYLLYGRSYDLGFRLASAAVF